MLENGAFLLNIEVLFEVRNDSDNLVEQLWVLHGHEALVADGLHYLNAGEGSQNFGVLSDVIEDLEGDGVWRLVYVAIIEVDVDEVPAGVVLGLYEVVDAEVDAADFLLVERDRDLVHAELSQPEEKIKQF